MPPVRMRGDGRKAKDPKKTLLRLMGYMKRYIPTLLIVMVCIVVNAMASTTGSENIGNLVDDYILPMVASGNADYGPLFSYLLRICGIFAFGIVCSWLYNYLMVGVSQRDPAAGPRNRRPAGYGKTVQPIHGRRQRLQFLYR